MARAVVQTVIGVSQIQVSRVIRRALERLRALADGPAPGRSTREQFGRGPTKTHTNWAGPDVLA